MKPLLFSIGILLSLNAFSNDTLTRAQVYNFSVGDTFDYQYWYSTNATGAYGYQGPVYDSTLGYKRYIVIGLRYSIDSAILFIERQQVYPKPTTSDTLSIDSLNAFQYLLYNYQEAAISIIDASTYYNGRQLNIWLYGDQINKSLFADGLGVVLNQRGNLQYGIWWYLGEKLIYYSKGTENWGTPYYNLPTSVNEIPNEVRVQLFPNPSTGSWQLTVDESLVGNKVEVFNTEGQMVFQSEIKNQKSEISFPSARGVYMLHISSPEGNIIRKLVKL